MRIRVYEAAVMFLELKLNPEFEAPPGWNEDALEHCEAMFMNPGESVSEAIEQAIQSLKDLLPVDYGEDWAAWKTFVEEAEKDGSIEEYHSKRYQRRLRDGK